MQNKGAKKAIPDVVGQMLQKEVIFLCSNSHKSLLTEDPNKGFGWFSPAHHL